MQDILRVLPGGGVIIALDFIEGRVPPPRLIARTQLSIPASDLQMRVLHRRLVQMLLVKLQQSGLVQVEHINALTNSNRTLLQPREDSVHETHLTEQLPLLDLRLHSWNQFGVLQEEIEDDGLAYLL